MSITSKEQVKEISRKVNLVMHDDEEGNFEIDDRLWGEFQEEYELDFLNRAKACASA